METDKISTAASVILMVILGALLLMLVALVGVLIA